MFPRAAGAFLLALFPLGCGPSAPPRTSSEELMFALPNWCGRSGKREKWDEWAVARDRAPTGTGVCGVRVDITGGGDTDVGEAGMCLTLEQGAVARMDLRQRGATLLPKAIVGMPAKDADATVRVRVDVPGAATREVDVAFRLVGSSLRAVAPDGSSATGPCFWK